MRQETGSRLKPPPSPEKVTRARSNSLSAVTSTPAPTIAGNRKRTSSGVFKIDEVEPPTKKDKDKEPEKSAENNVTVKQNEKIESNGDKIKDKRKQKDVIVREFDRESKSNCVTVFKESDSWD